MEVVYLQNIVVKASVTKYTHLSYLFIFIILSQDMLQLVFSLRAFGGFAAFPAFRAFLACLPSFSF